MAVHLVATVATRMQLDPHADPHTRGYSVEGIYFETQARDVFNRMPGYSRRKFRIRRYGNGDTVFLERKSKRQGIVTKRRLQLESNEVMKFLSETLSRGAIYNSEVEGQAELDSATEMSWFVNRIYRLKLRPTLCIAYERVAFLQMEGNFPIRLTVDRSLSCCPFVQTGFPSKLDYSKFLESNCVVELKYQNVMPGCFRDLIDEFQLISWLFPTGCIGIPLRCHRRFR